MTPFKAFALHIVTELVQLLFKGTWKNIVKHKRFQEEYTADSLDDTFKIGISLNKGVLSFYESFEEADIILASPAGLQTLGSVDARNEGRREFDFLSSIQILILDQAEVFMYQNLEHLEYILKNINNIPKRTDNLGDISRIQDRYLEKLAKKFRQTIVVQKFRTQDLEYLMKKYCFNSFQGKISILNNYSENKMSGLAEEWSVRTSLKRINTSEVAKADDLRYNYFTTKVWPKLEDNLVAYTVVFCSTYFEFVRLKRFFKNKNTAISFISEYTDDVDCHKQRARFEREENRFLLVSERALVFDKIELRYAQNIVFYSLPEALDIFDSLKELMDPEKGLKIKSILESRERVKEAKRKEIMEERGRKVYKTRREEREEEAKIRTDVQFEADLKQKRKEITEGSSMVFGHFTAFDTLKLERLVGKKMALKMCKDEVKDTWKFN